MLSLSRINSKVFLIIFYILISACPIFGLYEDQIGKFDWIQRYVGDVEKIVFDKSSSPSRRVIVSTSQNVIAALSTKTGDILWRHILEPTEVGKVEVLATNEHYVYAVTGNLIRSWDVISAALKEEILLDSVPNWSESFGHIFGFGTNWEDLLLVVLSVGQLDVHIFDTVSGSSIVHRTIPTEWMQPNTRCALGGDVLVCLDALAGNIFSLVLTSKQDNFSSISLSQCGIDEVTVQQAAANPSTVSLSNVIGSTSHLVVKVGANKKLVHVHKKEIHLVRDLTGIQGVAIDNDSLLMVTQSLRMVTLQVIEITSGTEFAEHGIVVELPTQSGAVQGLAVHQFSSRDGSLALRAFVTCSDHSIHLISSAGVVWSREESLATILSADAVDLPVAGAESTYQDQLPYEAGLISSLYHRMRSQASQVVGWFNSILGRSDEFDNARHILTRDQFNIRKLIVVVTNSGKVIALDSWTGEITWSVFVPVISPFKNNKILFFTQRTSAHFPRTPQCVITAKHKITGEGLLYVFNPLTGEGIGENGGIYPLGYHLLQASLLQQMDENYIKPLLLIDSNLNVHTFPSNGEVVLLQWKHSLYVHLAIPGSSILKGYSLKDSKPGALSLNEVWSLNLDNSGVITGVYGKRIHEKVHSAGRVLADRSVLYKYDNPNLAVVTTFGQDNLSKSTLTVHLIDTVTGSILESVTHKRVTKPFHVVHSENWVVYTCYNEKFRRHEVISLELFEGLEQGNATAFSSFGAKVTPPIVERQAFIIPYGVQATSHTTTEQGITTKFILFALETGNILQMSKWFLDPRRPMTPSGPREEGLVPYMPELPLLPQEMINHNTTLPRVSAIYTSPTGLESTCLVFIYGLDVFYTRVFPSKMFDVLKDDFDHYLIIGALLSLSIAAIVTRKLAQRKALKQAWK